MEHFDFEKRYCISEIMLMSHTPRGGSRSGVRYAVDTAWRVATWARPRAAVADRDRGRQVIGGRDSRRSDSAGRGVTLISNILRGARRLTPPQSPGRGSAPKTRKTNPHSGSARHALTFGTKCRGHMSHVSFAGCITQVAPARRTAGGKGRPSTANCLSVGYSLIFSQPPRNEARSLGATHLASTTASRH